MDSKKVIKTPTTEKVRMLDRFDSRKQSIGTLYLTETHLLFIDSEKRKETWIIYMQIASVQKLSISTGGSPLQIRCKNFLCVTFVIPRERDRHEIYTSLLQMSQTLDTSDLYCFRYIPSNNDLSKLSGCDKFDLHSEYSRMGIPNEYWHLTTINENYEICNTYSKHLCVPVATTASILLGSSSFRSRGRLPVLSYLHKNMAAICRCSQPLAGISAQCIEDQEMINCILQACPNAKHMYVVDTRPRINAMANRAAGKGYENENFYENIKFRFFAIENIHAMRNSLQKLLETCEMSLSSMNAFIAGLEQSGWLKHIKMVLETSLFIAKCVESGVNVLVHCSDGWDRTSQTCALASLLLDSYYRTITGFQALIEKDWLSFGHKFTERCGHIQGDPKQVSPIFTQFIEAVWQLTEQFPCSFQFNERFLLELHDHVYSCQFGTFIGNCEKEREDLSLKTKTYSLWDYFSNHSSEFLNPLYKSEYGGDDMVRPCLAPQFIRFWKGMYNRFENSVHPKELLSDMLLATKNHISSLENHAQLLEKRLNQSKKSLDSHIQPEKLTDAKQDLAIVQQIVKEIDSIALDWKKFNEVQECVCSTPFNQFIRKVHCWSCGNLFCEGCIDKQIPLPGHCTKRPVPVCRCCYKKFMTMVQ